MASEEIHSQQPGSASAAARIDYLDGLRGVAIVMVVCIHAIGYCALEGSARDVVSFLVHTAAVPAVPRAPKAQYQKHKGETPA